ncbi:MAG: AgmX/PglI C-terminal domain-containing protein [Deltaproteobacteria bacterium]|nr:AgmX/PglI C-terminal domain-containing protein [Deltaproteobacteria bacterium]
MSSSEPERESHPPSLTPPASSGSGLYLAGMVLVGGLIVGLVMWKRGQDQEANAPPKPTAAATLAASATGPSATATVAANLPEFAPPALRQDDEIPSAKPKGGTAPAGGEEAAEGGSKGGKGAKGEKAEADGPDSGAAKTCSACGSGVSNATLNGAIRSRAGTAQGCYQRALRDGGAEGTITVAVSVGSDGSVCGASVASDTIHNPAISGCVLGKFRGSSYPPPTEGCVTVQVPITFKQK